MEPEVVSTEVRTLIGLAYGLDVKEDLVETGDTDDGSDPPSQRSASADCCSLLTIGVSKALGPDMLSVEARKCKVLVELGMGTGRVALQSFLQCPCLQKVVGVEICVRRFTAARTAIGRLADANPGRFRIESNENSAFPSAVLHDGPRMLEMRCGDLLAVPIEEIRAANAIIAQVNPDDFRKNEEMQTLLNYASDGCRLLSGKDLASVWRLDAACCWHTLKPGSTEAAEDSHFIPGGYKTFLFEANSSIPPSISKSEEAPGKNNGSPTDVEQAVLIGLLVAVGIYALVPLIGVGAIVKLS
eukprot:gnl/MRDRNA2_/MRDRNA2_164261_c0_seq1.p1 gnl/MRDRNA2_/MRDRNA2_164261_c0~~gnl/MRDRNA2_/MRDRNA2_164261_c0_seq1.p1  ORF type:complete len:300 (-),score=41.30 gnl/MRDRNA2_/MRDRNA2_164261_c0_seq1:42-941(-)